MCTLTCDHVNVESVKHYAKLLSDLLSQYRWLVDSYVLDYFVENHWQKLPRSWQEVLHDAEPEDLSTLLETGVPTRRKAVWPLSLLALVRTAKVYPLRRTAVASEADILMFSVEDVKGTTDNTWSTPGQNGPNENLNHAFRKHVKPKKQHEISRLAKVVHLLAHKTKCRKILDVGGGRGHLARLLALGYGYEVATVDSVGGHLAAANRFDDQAAVHVEKVQQREGSSICHKDLSTGPPKHITLKVSPTTKVGDLKELVQKTWNVDHEDGKFVMVGLHACGDLGPSALRLFAQTRECRAIALVGCCYMKVTRDGQSAQTSVAPSSKYLTTVCERGFSYESREVACHALEAYVEKLRDDPQSLKIHCYRALLETIIVSMYPEQRHAALGSVKRAARTTFSQYAAKALEKFELEVPENETSSPQLEEKMKEWKRVVIFYSLRLLLAPLVESLILADRVLYLWEHGISSCLVPLFVPELSPRNYVLLAAKHEYERL